MWQRQIGLPREEQPEPVGQCQGVVPCLPDHWVLRQMMEDLALTRAEVRVVSYVLHPLHSRHYHQYIGVVITDSRVYIIQGYTAPVETDLSQRSSQQALTTCYRAAWIWRERFFWYAFRLLMATPAFNHRVFSQVSSLWTMEPAFLDDYFNYAFNRMLVLSMSVPHLRHFVRNIFSFRRSQRNMTPLLHILGLVYERSGAEPDSETEWLAVEATLCMKRLCHPELSWVNSHCPQGLTLLMLAAPLPAVVTILLTCRADLELRSQNGTSFLQEILGRHARPLPILTIQTLLLLAMSRRGTVTPWVNAQRCVLDTLHDNVLENPDVMSTLIGGQFFTPSCRPLIPSHLSEQAQSFLKALTRSPLPLKTLCWQVMFNTFNNQVVRGANGEDLNVPLPCVEAVGRYLNDRP